MQICYKYLFYIIGNQSQCVREYQWKELVKMSSSALEGERLVVIDPEECL